MIKININLTAINKERIFDGKKGKYLNAVLIPTPNSKYDNDYMIVEETTKEEREKDIKGNIIGNGKIFETSKSQNTEPENLNNDDDLPF